MHKMSPELRDKLFILASDLAIVVKNFGEIRVHISKIQIFSGNVDVYIYFEACCIIESLTT